MKYILGNWKLNKTVAQTKEYLAKFKQIYQKNKDAKVGIAVPYTDLSVTRINGGLTLAQDVSAFDHGAYTSQISVELIKQFKNVKGSLVGHSEVRTLLHDTNQNINQKVLQLLNNDLYCVFCIGETKSEYENNQTTQVIDTQIREGLANVPSEKLKKLIVAYEPVWAIGTGLTATNEIVSQVCQKVHEILADLFGKVASKKIAVLYGGSVKSSNANAICNLPGVDGVLVGGASLDPEEFNRIAQAAN
ncbi:MAG: triose-phosphate isomerase [Mycoplasmataceae bacterium]|nr:triose-phosphate isomerase [Mycoplasmataceae bacterium]